MEISVFEFALKAESNFFLPAFKGATFRGKFGNVLKKVICFNLRIDCDHCSFTNRCPYIYLFMTRYSNGEETLKPFVIKPPLDQKQFFLKDDKFYLQLTLIGKAIEYFPYFVYCFLQMGKEGIGNPAGKFKLEHIWNFDQAGERKLIYESEEKILNNEIERISLSEIQNEIKPQLTLNFLTPTQIKQNGKVLHTINFEILLKAIFRRYKRLNYLHDNGQKIFIEVDWDEIKKIEVLNEVVKNYCFWRYSNKQKKLIPVQGIIGKIVLRGNLTTYYRWLKIGEYLHVGKGATFGLGWYRVV
ncbi:CRISPR system precrRNA processing endoribonuclease RAMP protein Cas6 [Calditrichota bacterium LG25]